MTSQPDLTRKVRQLDNDVQSIYEILARIELTQVRHGNRFSELDERLEGVEQRLESHDARFDVIDARFDVIDTRFDVMDARFDGIDTKLDQVIALIRAAAR